MSIKFKVNNNLLLFTILSMLMISCGPVSQTENSTEEQRAGTVMSDEIPEWLKELYPNKIERDGQSVEQQLTEYRIVNKEVSYCVYKQMDGVCDKYFLSTYVNHEQKANMLIGHECDHDLAVPSHSWRLFTLGDADAISTVEYTESVPDSLIDEEGWIKEEYDYLEAEKTMDSVIQLFRVNDKGQIIEISK